LPLSGEGQQDIRALDGRQSPSERAFPPMARRIFLWADEAIGSRFPLSGVNAELSRLTVSHERVSVQAFPKNLFKENSK